MNKTLKLPRITLPGLALALSLSVPAVAAEKPNIILMISDDHRWDCMGVAGNPNIHTPNMDRLAKEGLYFSEGTIYIPQCSPSRATMLTGLAPHTNGRYSNQTSRLDMMNANGFDDYLCMPEVLSEQGYATVLVGKWHLAPDPWNVGFQEVGTWMPAGSGPYQNAQLAEGKSRVTKPNPKLTQEAFGESASRILREHADGRSTQPLFMWFALTAPHSPYEPNPEEATRPYEGKSTSEVLPLASTYRASLENNRDGKFWDAYVEAISSVDLELGKLMKTLDETGMSTNTVVVFLGDNGFMMGYKDIHGKVVPWEDSVKVPYIIWGPGVFKGKGKTMATASSIDLPPTFARLAGTNPPSEWQGRDLTPVLQDGQSHDFTWSVSEFPDYKNWKFPGICYRTVRTTTSKLIVWHELTGKAPEFYNIVKDPGETNNLYDDPSVKQEVTALHAILNDWMKKTDDNWKMRGELTETEKPGRGGKKGKRKASSDDD